MIRQGNLYAVTFQTSALSTAGGHDLASLLSTQRSALLLRLVRLHQVSTNILANLEGLAISIWRGSTGVPAGAALTPVPWDYGHGSGSTAKSAATGNSSSVISTTSASRLFHGAMTADGFIFKPDRCDAPRIENDGQLLHILSGTPNAVGPAMAGTVVFEEIGIVPGR